MPDEAAHQLQTTVEHFGAVNRELLHELTALAQLLTGRPPTTPTPQSAPSPQFLAPAPELSRESLTAQNGQQPAPVSPPSSSAGYWDTPRHAAPSTSPRVQTNRRGSAPRTGRWRRDPGR
jgi:hypothetical protein